MTASEERKEANENKKKEKKKYRMVTGTTKLLYASD